MLQGSGAGDELSSTDVSVEDRHRALDTEWISMEEWTAPHPSERSLGRVMPAFHEMVSIVGGVFTMGSDRHYPDEAPLCRVHVDPFRLDRHPVTNRQFASFVEATGYRTTAEIPPDPLDYPGMAPEMIQAASLVFRQPPSGMVVAPLSWWELLPGADWRHPSGPESSTDGSGDHPVVHVTHADAAAYAAWAGLRLPTEAEWEFAARGGLDGAEYAWGDELEPNDVPRANYWRGQFPYTRETSEPAGTSRVGSYPSNGYGLLDMIGNVWEWTADWYSPQHEKRSASGCCIPRNPRGGREASSYDGAVTETRIGRRVLKGGSHLCAANYCQRYRPAARYPQPIDTSTSHVGFRCAAPMEG